MNSNQNDILQKRFSQIKRLSFLIFGSMIIFTGLGFAADLPKIEIGLANILFLVFFTSIGSVISGIFFSMAYKIHWVKRLLFGRDSVQVDE